MEDDLERLDALWQYVSQVNAGLDESGILGEGVTKEALLRSLESLNEHFVRWIRTGIISK